MIDHRFSSPVLIAAALAALCSCAVGPQFTRPATSATNRYTDDQPLAESEQTAGNAAQRIVYEEPPAAWWTAFKSEELNELVKRALANNRSLAAAAASLAQAQELAGAASGSLYPQADLSASAGRRKYGTSFFGSLAKPPPFTYFAVGPNVSYTLDFAGGIGRSVEARRALAEYSRQQLEAANISVAGNTIYLALKIAAVHDEIAAIEEIQNHDRETLKLVNIAFENGLVSRLDILSAQSQLASDLALMPALRQELSVNRHALSVVLGTSIESIPTTQLNLAQFVLPATLSVGQPSELAHRRPDILAAEAQLHAATAEVGIASANLYPHITLTAAASQEATTLSQLFDASSNAWGLVAGLTAPIFDGGTLRAERRAAIDSMHASAANYEHVVLTSFAQVADVLDALGHDAEQLAAESQARESAQQSADLARQSYHEGNSTVLQVLDAERLYQQASLGYVRATAQQYLDTAQLYVALGGQSPDR